MNFKFVKWGIAIVNLGILFSQFFYIVDNFFPEFQYTKMLDLYQRIRMPMDIFQSFFGPEGVLKSCTNLLH